MAIADFTPVTEAISFKDKPLMTVRGLSVEDISNIVAAHLDDIERLVELQEGASSELFSRISQQGFSLKLLQQAPQVVATAIALAAGEPEAFDKVKSFPTGLTLKCIEAVIRLTLEDIGGPKGLSVLLRTLRT